MSTFYGITQAQVTQLTTQRMQALRDALNDVEDLYGWTSGLADTDLENLGFLAGDADTLLSAVADANAVAQIYSTGLPPGSYPQPSSAYVYAATQRQIMGPQ